CTDCAPPGACCLNDGTCLSQTTQAFCQTQPLFVAWSAGVLCSAGPCVGRCCNIDGTCTLTGTANCPTPSRFGGLGTICYQTYSYGNPSPPTVPIQSATPVDSVIPVTESFVVGDVNVRVLAEHNFRGDILLELISPDGTSRTIFDN